jgi:hypothetical protein
MRKSTIFISAALTTFALVMLYGVVSAYRNISNVTEAAALTSNTATTAPTEAPTESAPAPTAAATVVMPEQAAQMAAQVVGNTNLLSAESSNFNGVDAYKITFTNNDVVYVGLDGQILAVQIAPVVVNVQAPVPAAPVQHKDRNKSSDNSNTTPVQNYEDHEEHED